MERKVDAQLAASVRTEAPAAASEPRVPFEQTEDYHRVLAAAHEHLLNRIDDEQIDIDAWSPVTVARFVHTLTERFVQQWRVPVNAAEMQIVAAALVRELTGFGPLDELLRDPGIDHILINGYKEVHVSRGGERARASQRFTGDDHVLRILRRLLAPLGIPLDDNNPIVDTKLPGGGQLNAIIPPLALDGPIVSIHKVRRHPFGLDHLLRMGAFDPPMHALLRAMVSGRCNVLVCGASGSGRTSLLNAMANEIPATQRVVTVEETAELTLDHPLVVRLESPRGGSRHQRTVSAAELLHNSLRMRPDRILVGEVRGAEMLELLMAMATGCDGSMATLHASSARDCLRRIETLAGAAGFQGSTNSLHWQIAGALDVIVHVIQLGNGRRVIASINEVDGVSDDGIGLRELFRYERLVDSDGSETDRWEPHSVQTRGDKLDAFQAARIPRHTFAK